MAPVKPNERKQKSRKKQKEAKEATRAAKAADSKRRRDEQKAEMAMLEAPMNIRTATEATSVVTSQTLSAYNHPSSAAQQQSQPSDRETPSFDHSNDFGQKTMSITSSTDQSSDVHEAHQPRGCEEAPSFASDDGSSNPDRSLKHPNLAVDVGASVGISTSRKSFSSSTTMTDTPTLSHERPTITPMKSPPAAAAVGSGGHSAKKKKRSRESSVDLDHLQDAVTTSIDSPIPKKKKKQRIDASPQASTASPKPNFFVVYNRNSNEIDGKMMRDFEPTPAFEYNQPHVRERLEQRGGTPLIMFQGKIVPASSSKHEGFEFAYKDEETGVTHIFPFTILPDKLRIETYKAHSPFRTINKYKPRRKMLYDGLKYLGFFYGKQLDEVGGFIVQAIVEAKFLTLYCHRTPEAMDVIDCILPNLEEIDLLKDIPKANEMGAPEAWVVAVGENEDTIFENWNKMHRIVGEQIRVRRTLAGTQQELTIVRRTLAGTQQELTVVRQELRETDREERRLRHENNHLRDDVDHLLSKRRRN